MAEFIKSFVQSPYDQVPVDSGSSGESPCLTRQHTLLTADSHPELYEINYRGKLFSGFQAPAGAAPALWSATTQQCGLMNPLGSGVNLVLENLAASYVSGTSIVNGLCLAYVAGCGSTVAGPGGVSAVTTQCTPVALNLSGVASSAIFMASAITTAAPSYLLKLGITSTVLTATEKNPPWVMYYDFSGNVIVPPGKAIFISADITGITAVYSFGLVWAEIKQ